MNLERIAKLLASGLKPSQVASIVGCSPARISQLMQEERFLNIYQPLIAEADKEFSEDTAIDSKYLSVEHALLKTIEEQAPTADLKDATNALRVITERQFRKKQLANPAQHGNLTINQRIVNLSIPMHAAPEITINETGEVTSVNQQSLAPLSSQGVLNLFKQLKGESHEPASLPATAGQVPLQAFPA